MNTINLRALASLASELNMHVSILELKLQSAGITIQKTEPCVFHSNTRNKRRSFLELY